MESSHSSSVSQGMPESGGNGSASGSVASRPASSAPPSSGSESSSSSAQSQPAAASSPTHSSDRTKSEAIKRRLPSRGPEGTPRAVLGGQTLPVLDGPPRRASRPDGVLYILGTSGYPCAP